MKPHPLLLSSILLTVLPAQPPTLTGFLRIYNCLSEGATFIPHVDGRKLSHTPMKPGSSSTGMIFHAGLHTIHLRSEAFRFPSLDIHIKPEYMTTAVAFHLLNKKTKTLQPYLVSLDQHLPPPINADCQTLRIKSFSQKTRTLKLGERTILIEPAKAQLFRNWKGNSFTLTERGIPIKHITPQEASPHTLLLWDRKNGDLNTLIIAHTTPESPPEIRADLSLGRTKNAIPNLRMIQPVAPP